MQLCQLLVATLLQHFFISRADFNPQGFRADFATDGLVGIPTVRFARNSWQDRSTMGLIRASHETTRRTNYYQSYFKTAVG